MRRPSIYLLNQVIYWHLIRRYVCKQKAKSAENEKILEMAAIMQKAVSLNEEKENEQIGLIQRLATENRVNGRYTLFCECKVKFWQMGPGVNFLTEIHFTLAKSVYGLYRNLDPDNKFIFFCPHRISGSSYKSAKRTKKVRRIFEEKIDQIQLTLSLSPSMYKWFMKTKKNRSINPQAIECGRFIIKKN